MGDGGGWNQDFSSRDGKKGRNAEQGGDRATRLGE